MCQVATHEGRFVAVISINNKLFVTRANNLISCDMLIIISFLELKLTSFYFMRGMATLRYERAGFP